MAKTQSPAQHKTIAIALHEGGASNQATPAETRKTLKNTKAREARGATGQAQTRGKKKAKA